MLKIKTLVSIVVLLTFAAGCCKKCKKTCDTKKNVKVQRKFK